MEDFTALAARVAARVSELRGCLILSRDGLVLGSFPQGDEALVKSAWLRFAALGEPEKGFLDFGSETWCFVRRGPYAAFALAEAGSRPGLILDEMDACLLRAEELRERSVPLEVPEASDAAGAKPGPPAQVSSDEEIDRVLLAREFRRLLQEGPDGDEA